MAVKSVAEEEVWLEMMGVAKNKADGNISGFTLIEMSIVLVFVGLVIGGVLTGRYLIKASELQSIITDEQRYITAVNTFRTKYNELPGDMVDATNYWGTDPNGCPDGGATSTPQITTCDGNGDGVIECEAVPDPLGFLKFEGFRAWQQLADAGLIQGAFTGQPFVPSNSWSYMPGVNIPATRIPNGGFAWMVFSAAGGQESAGTWNAQINVQYLLLGTPDSNSGKLLDSLLTPSDAYAIDLKMDDGQPASGNILASNTAACLVSGAGPYNLSTTAPACTLLFAVKDW